MYTTFEGAILHTELMNFKELPLRGGSINTTSYLRPEAASFSICSPASPAMNFTFFKLLSLQFVRASFTASRLSSTPVTDKALSEAQIPIVPIPLYASKTFSFHYTYKNIIPVSIVQIFYHIFAVSNTPR